GASISLRIAPRRLRRDSNISQELLPPSARSLLQRFSRKREHIRRPPFSPVRLVQPRNFSFTHKADRNLCVGNACRGLHSLEELSKWSHGHSHLFLPVQHHFLLRLAAGLTRRLFVVCLSGLPVSSALRMRGIILLVRADNLLHQVVPHHVLLAEVH